MKSKTTFQKFQNWRLKRQEAQFYNFPKRTYYNEYGKVLRIKPMKFLKKAFIFDVIAPLTFGIPTIIGLLGVLFTFGKEIVIDLGENK